MSPTMAPVPTLFHRAVTKLAAWVAAGTILLMGGGTPLLGANGPQTHSLAGFIDDLGHRVEDDTLQKPLRLIAFGYTSCPDVCPTTLLAVHQALIQLGEEAVIIDPAFVTVDPDRDSVARLHQYVSTFDARIRGYRGSATRLDLFARSLHVQYWREGGSPETKDYAMSHTSTLFLLRRDGSIAARIENADDADTLARFILKAVRASYRIPHESHSGS